MKNNFSLTRILNIIGICLSVLSFILLCYEQIPLLYLCALLILSCLFMLPDSILFTIRKFRENEHFAIYWGAKFIGLIIAIIIFFIGFLILLSKDLS